jgi:hypothetical protein
VISPFSHSPYESLRNLDELCSERRLKNTLRLEASRSISFLMRQPTFENSAISSWKCRSLPLRGRHSSPEP